MSVRDSGPSERLDIFLHRHTIVPGRYAFACRESSGKGMEADVAVIDSMLQELDQEAATTRRVLERVPDKNLGCRPHAKARTLGELALHIAMVPGAVAEIAV